MQMLKDGMREALSAYGSLVFGEGPLSAALAMVGEAPGEQEALQGRPFVGKAGQNLNAFLSAVSLDRSQIYVTNVVKIRPTRISPAGNTVNRPPSRTEIADFLPWLERELLLIRPVCILTLGNTPLQALMGKAYSVGQHHGSIVRWKDIPLYVMYHPASVIYNPALKAVYQEDMLRFAEIIFPQI